MTLAHSGRPATMRAKWADEPWLGWGIIGASTVAARYFIPALRDLTESRGTLPPSKSRVVAICSSNLSRARTFADQQQIPHIYDDIHALLARPDIQCIYVANQVQRHAEAVIAALDAGKHILCEPPISADPDQVEALVTRAHIRTRHLWVNHFWRYDPAIRKMHEALREEELGGLLSLDVSNSTVLSPQAQSWRLRPGAGILWDRTIQDIDLILYLLGEMPEMVWATSGRHVLGQHAEIDEEIAAILQWPDGTLVRLHDTYFDAHTPASATLHGTYGVLHADTWTTPQPQTALTHRQRSRTTRVEVAQENPLQTILANFMRVVRSTPVPNQNVVETQDHHPPVVRIVAALHEACRRGHAIQVQSGPA